jgi:hypothetical protein
MRVRQTSPSLGVADGTGRKRTVAVCVRGNLAARRAALDRPHACVHHSSCCGTSTAPSFWPSSGLEQKFLSPPGVCSCASSKLKQEYAPKAGTQLSGRPSSCLAGIPRRCFSTPRSTRSSFFRCRYMTWIGRRAWFRRERTFSRNRWASGPEWPSTRRWVTTSSSRASPDLIQTGFHAGGSLTRQHIGVQSHHSRRPPRGHAQAMCLFDVLVELLSGQDRSCCKAASRNCGVRPAASVGRSSGETPGIHSSIDRPWPTSILPSGFQAICLPDSAFPLLRRRGVRLEKPSQHL